MEEKEKDIEDVLSWTIFQAEKMRHALMEVTAFKVECSEIVKQAEYIRQTLILFLTRFVTSNDSLYESPVRPILAEVTDNIGRALTLFLSCSGGVISRLVTPTNATDILSVSDSLSISISNIDWLVNLFDSATSGDMEVSLPAIAVRNPILPWVWSLVASIQMGPSPDRFQAANDLNSLALDSDHNKKIIVEEGGIPPLLKLLKEENVSPKIQFAAANTLLTLVTDEEIVRIIARKSGIPVIAQVLLDSSMIVQTRVANLVTSMVRHDPQVQYEFAMEDIVRPLVSLLSIDVFLDKPNHGKPIIHFTSSSSSAHSSSSSRGNKLDSPHVIRYYGGYYREGDGGNEKRGVKMQLKISCAEALWMLSKENVSISRRITETKGLTCLARLIQEEQEEELQHYCLVTVMQITSAAESDAHLRDTVFKKNCSSGKAVVEQLVRVVREVSSPLLKIVAIKSIGSLARIFPAQETRVIALLVSQLGDEDGNVAAAAAIALGKFASPNNPQCVDHAKAIIDLYGIPPLMRLLPTNERNLFFYLAIIPSEERSQDIELMRLYNVFEGPINTELVETVSKGRIQFHAVTLLCYLTLHVGSSDALEQAGAINALHKVANFARLGDDPLKELILKAIDHFEAYLTLKAIRSF